MVKIRRNYLRAYRVCLVQFNCGATLPTGTVLFRLLKSHAEARYLRVNLYINLQVGTRQENFSRRPSNNCYSME